jgi:ketosteroid isomerase-like protein
MADRAFDHVIEENHRWLGEFIRGNVEPVKQMFSHREDVTLAGPLPTAHSGTVPIARGWSQVAATLERAVAHFRDGALTGFENLATHVTPDLACTIELERFTAKVGAREDTAPVVLRVTSVFRREDQAWKLVHRHADPVTTVQPAESISQR